MGVLSLVAAYGGALFARAAPTWSCEVCHKAKTPSIVRQCVGVPS